MFERIKAVLIDFDGTLVDTEPLHFQANAAVFKQYGHEIDEKEYYLHWSVLGEGPAGEIQRYQLKDISPAKARDEARLFFKQLVETKPIPALPGAELVLQELPRRGYTTLIASNTSPELIRKMMFKSGLDGFDVPIIGGGPGIRGKPAPDIYLNAMRFLNMEPFECLAVEDSRKGLDAALTAGLSCVLVKYPRYPEFDTSGACLILNRLDDLLKFLPGVA